MDDYKIIELYWARKEIAMKESLVWEAMSEREIDGDVCHAFELRYSEDETINGEMAGRLLGIYAVSKDGKKFYQYNMANDTWE